MTHRRRGRMDGRPRGEGERGLILLLCSTRHLVPCFFLFFPFFRSAPLHSTASVIELCIALRCRCDASFSHRDERTTRRRMHPASTSATPRYASSRTRRDAHPDGDQAEAGCRCPRVPPRRCSTDNSRRRTLTKPGVAGGEQTHHRFIAKIQRLNQVTRRRRRCGSLRR